MDMKDICKSMFLIFIEEVTHIHIEQVNCTCSDQFGQSWPSLSSNNKRGKCRVP